MATTDLARLDGLIDELVGLGYVVMDSDDFGSALSGAWDDGRTATPRDSNPYS